MLSQRLPALLLLAAVALAGCSPDPEAAAANRDSSVSTGSGSPIRVSTADFTSVIANPDVQIIDVRTPEEFAEGHIPGAVNMPVQAPDFTAQVAELDPNGTYAVYCRSGNRSQPAVAAMERAGITKIYELASGTIGWTSDGRSLTR